MILFHGGLLLSGTFRGTYDAYVHMFFGDHYARDWFSTWDQRWYTGFTTVSYPPGTHMSLAAVSKVTGGLESAFVVVQLSVLCLLTVGVYRYSRLWVDREAAANASVLFALSSAIAETVHLFGQLPTTFALAFLLNAIPSIRRWVFDGRVTDLAVGIVVLAACTAGHHVTTLFGSVFFLGPVLLAGLLAQSRISREGGSNTAPSNTVRSKTAPSNTVPSTAPSITRATFVPLVARRLRRIWPALIRTAILAPAVVLTLVLVVLPYWLWSGSDPINQIPIPHGSRANFLAEPNIGLMFFLIPWGLMLVILPYGLLRGLVDRMWPLSASIFVLFVLGTGGTTPIPRLLLGPAFEILTLDRFTFWATVQFLPLAGLFVKSLEQGSLAAWLRRTGGPVLVRASHGVLVLSLIAVSLFSATLARHRPFQPATIDPDPIVAFIEKDQHERWRFLTLGFGDQMAWLSAQTTATQVDGNYHSVRRLPELTSSSVERLEGAKYRSVSGLGSLQQFLEVPEKYHLKFVFSNDRFYDPLLHFLGWQRVGPLENGVVVWERADIEPLPAVLPVRELPVWQRFIWGTLPPLAIVSGLGLLAVGALRSGRGARPSPAFDSILWGPLRWFDGLLASQEGRLRAPVRADTDSETETEKHPDSRWGPRALASVRARLSRSVDRRNLWLRRVAISLAVLMVPLAWTLNRSEEPGPDEVTVAYYDHLDFRRWGEAYALLDPDERPDFELWRLQLSVEGGLLASFAKLDSIESQTVETEATQATVEVDLRYLTSLDWYHTERAHELVLRNGSWYLSPDEPELTVPPDQLARRAEVDYVIQGRRRVTSLTSELTDIQDRPKLSILSARLVANDDLPVVVGEVVNIDVDPADLTLTAILRDRFGEVLARYNATNHFLRALNPGQSTPFRIDFERVAASDKPDFDPLDNNPIELDDEVASVELYAKAVVTDQGLYQGLQLNQLELVEPDGASPGSAPTLRGELRNDGLDEAVVPMVLFSFLDAQGHVAWVERHLLAASVRPQRSREFIVALPETDLSESEIDVDVFANGIDPQVALPRTPAGVIDLPESSPFASLRVDLTTMLAPQDP